MGRDRKSLVIMFLAGFAGPLGGISNVVWPDEPSIKNYIENGSFEKTDIERNPVGWALGGADGLRFEIDEEVKYSGHQSLRITGNGIKLPQRGGVYPARDILVPANRVYNLEVWIKAKDVEFGRSAPLDGGYLSHLGRFIDGNYSGNSSLAIPEGTYDWTRFSFVHKWKEESFVPEPYRALIPTIMRGQSVSMSTTSPCVESLLCRRHSGLSSTRSRICCSSIA